MPVDLTETRATAAAVAAEWGLELGAVFELSQHSIVAAVGDDTVLKIAWAGDEESLDEAAALELWDGNGAVRVLRSDASRRALLEERAVPGTDLSQLPEGEANAAAVDVATRLWRRAAPPFRPVEPEVRRWLDRAEREGSRLVPRARELLDELGPIDRWLVHGDFHHHNILRHGDRFVAIDPKPYLADREYDVPSFLWNPLDYFFDDLERNEERIAAFVAAGLDDFRIRAWTVIRGAYLRIDPRFAAGLEALLR